MANFIRAIITRVTNGKIQRADAEGDNREFTNKESWGHYGFASNPLKGSEAIIISAGNWLKSLVVATEDRRYRPALQPGEVCIYTDEGDMIKIKRGRQIEITGGNKVTVTTMNLVANCTGTATISAAGGITLDGAGNGTTKGIVTADCVCAFTGAPHPHGSATIKGSV
ncbi:MAG: phage baseplate assembly protein [Proteobacteria bacterium]|nr:phage baseplate assembly protein [Pseudomonadota bacterium]